MLTATVIMAPVLLIILIFAFLFYRRIVKHQYVISSMKYEELERMQKELERVPSLTSMSYQGTITSMGAATPNNVRKQLMMHQNHQHSLPLPASPRHPLHSMYIGYQPRTPPHRQPFYPRIYSHPDHLPFDISMNPGGTHQEPRLVHEQPNSSRQTDKVPESPTWSNKSSSLSVLTV